MPPPNQSQSSQHWPRNVCLWQVVLALTICLFFCKKVSDSLEDFFCKRIRCDYEQVCTSWLSIFADSLRRDIPTVIVSAGIILVILSQRAFPTTRLSDLLHEVAKFVMAMGIWAVLVYDYEEVPWLDSCTFDRARRCYPVQRAGRAVVAGIVMLQVFLELDGFG